MSRLLAGMLSVTMLTTLLIILIVLLQDMNDLFTSNVIAGYVMFGVSLGCYLINRSGNVEAAALTFVGATTVNMLASAIGRSDEFVVFAVVPMLLVGIFYRLRWSLIYNIALLLIIFVNDSLIQSEEFWMRRTIWYSLVFASALIVTFKWHLGRLETIRRTQLIAINAQLDATIKAIPDALVTISQSGEILSYHAPNDGDIAWHEFVGQKPQAFMPKATADIITSALEEVATTNEPKRLEIDGQVRSYELSLAIRRQPGETDQFIAIVRDISDRKRLRDQLAKSEAQYRLYTELASDYAFSLLIGEDGNIELDWSTDHAFLRMTGHQREEFSAIARELFHPEDRTQLDEDWAMLRTGQSIERVYRILTKEREVLWARIIFEPIWDEDAGRVVRVHGVAIDVTEEVRLRNEIQAYTTKLEKLVDARTNALRRSNEQLALILQSTTDALAFAHPSGEILLSNPAFLDMFELDEVGSIDVILESLIDNEQQAAIGRAINAVIESEETHQLQVQIQTRPGHEKDIELSLIPIQLQDREPQKGVLLSGHDISHLKEIERFKERFVADALHDLATPISGLSTRVYLLQRDPNKLKEHVLALKNQVQHLGDLLGNLRELSQLDRGQLVLELQLCDINEVIQRVFDTYEPVAISRDQTLEKTLATLPGVRVDPKQIARVMVNLVSNAITYSSEGDTIHIETQRDDEHIIIRVIDNGSGIGVDDQSRIFERFFRTASARQNVSQGTGLGLAISHKIVELHGGSIQVQSEPGVGSTFTVHLPIQATGS